LTQLFIVRWLLIIVAVLALYTIASAAPVTPTPKPCEGAYDPKLGTNFGRCPGSAPKTSTGSIPESPGSGGSGGGDAGAGAGDSGSSGASGSK